MPHRNRLQKLTALAILPGFLVGQAFAAGTLELNDGDGDAVTFTTAADVGAGGYSLTFPAALGTNGQLLTIDGSGNIVFADAVVDSDTTYTGSGGVTLTGTDFTADLGTDIVTGEIVDGTILLADLDAASYETTTVDSTTDGDDLVTEAAVIAYQAANDSDTTYTAGSGLSLTGTEFAAADLSTTNIAAATLVDATDTVASNDNDTTIPTTAAVIDYVNANNDNVYSADGTLTEARTIEMDGGNSFRIGDYDDDGNSTYFEIASDISMGSNLGGSITITGEDIVLDAANTIRLGTTNDSSSIGAPVKGMFLYDSTGDELQYYNGTSWVGVTADTDTTYTGSGGVTLTGTDFTADLGTDIVTGEIVDGTILLADLDAASYETTTVDSTTDGDDLVTEAAVVAYVAANGDDLGDHEATQALDLNTFKLVGNDGTLGLVVDASGNVAVDGTITSSSDRNLKKNILPLTGALDKLLAITGVNYEWKDGRSAGTQIGVIAQDVQAVYPELVGSNDAGLTVNYAGLVAPLIEAVRAQQAQIDELKAEIDALKE